MKTNVNLLSALISAIIAICGVIATNYAQHRRQVRLTTLDFIKRYYFETALKQRIRTAIGFLATSKDDPSLAACAKSEEFTRLFDDLGSINFLISVCVRNKSLNEDLVRRVFIEYLAVTVLCAERLNLMSLRRVGYGEDNRWIYERWELIGPDGTHTRLALAVARSFGLSASGNPDGFLIFDTPVDFR